MGGEVTRRIFPSTGEKVFALALYAAIIGFYWFVVRNNPAYDTTALTILGREVSKRKVAKFAVVAYPWIVIMMVGVLLL